MLSRANSYYCRLRVALPFEITLNPSRPGLIRTPSPIYLDYIYLSYLPNVDPTRLLIYVCSILATNAPNR